MKPIPSSFNTLSRRVLLSTLAGLPALIGPLSVTSARAQGDPLPSWNDGATKSSITNFVARVTTKGGPDFVPPDQRIATFDNDGTLWCEHPIYVQFAFIFARVKALAPQHPDWKSKQPFQAVLDGDMKALAASGEKGLVELMAATHAGMTTDEFLKIVTDWLASARDPRFKRPYTELDLSADAGAARLPARQRLQDLHRLRRRHRVHAPLDRAGLRHSARAGRRLVDQDQVRDAGRPAVLFRLPEINFIDDGPGKPVGINEHIGRRPIAAFGNSDGDLEMLQWTTMSGGVRFGLIVHHTDAEREYAYDRHAHFGKLDKALDAAAVNKWTVVSMKSDWKKVFPFQ